MLVSPAHSHRPLRRWPLYLLVAVAALVPTAVSAHGGGGPGIVQFNPLIWLGLILIGAAYFYATGIIEQRDPEAVTPRQLWYFLGGICSSSSSRCNRRSTPTRTTPSGCI